jgi:hypothetical protein
LDFGQNRWSAPNYLGQSQQRRLLLLMLTVGAVLAAVYYAANPHSWLWLTRLGRPRPDHNHAAIDTRLKPRPPSDAVVMAAPQAAAVPNRGERFPGVDAQLLARVRDDTPIGRSELPAMFQLLGLARRSDPRALAEASVGTPALVQLLQQPDVFRGQVVTVRGRVHGVFEFQAEKNEAGVREWFQLWIEPDDDRSSPIVLDCLDLPKAFPRGSNLNEAVEATGFYFKRLAYYLERDKSLQLAPLVLAENVEWAPLPAAVQPAGMDWKRLALAVSVALLAAIVLLTFVLPRRRTTEASRFQISGRRPTAGLDQLDELRNLEVSAESSEALRRIAESEQAEKKSDA